MQASDREFTHRASIFGMIFGVCFSLYAVDSRNAVSAVSDWLAPPLHLDPDQVARGLLAGGAVLVAVAALVRTWASAYLRASIVYASQVQSDSLVADGPYRYVRNPLYFANVLLAAGMASMMNREGGVLAVAAMLVFSYRLIFREEAQLLASQSTRYERYRQAVPRLWPAQRARVAATGQRPAWRDGFQVESWCWGFAAALATFAATLDSRVFFAILAASFLLLWLSSRQSQKRRGE